jgi:hypothetical protein
MTTLVEEMAKAMAPGAFHSDDKDYWQKKAQAALECVLKRLREPDDGMIDIFVEWRDAGTGWEKFYPALATRLDQERSRE